MNTKISPLVPLTCFIPLSIVVTCPMLPSPANGEVTYSDLLRYTNGTVATYSCGEGFGLSGGDVTRTCEGDGSSPNGAWSGVTPSCEGI